MDNAARREEAFDEARATELSFEHCSSSRGNGRRGKGETKSNRHIARDWTKPHNAIAKPSGRGSSKKFFKTVARWSEGFRNDAETIRVLYIPCVVQND